MKRKIFRVLAAILCAATVAQSIPVFAYSNDSDVIDSESFSQRVNFRSFRVSFRSSRPSRKPHKTRLFRP